MADGAFLETQECVVRGELLRDGAQGAFYETKVVLDLPWNAPKESVIAALREKGWETRRIYSVTDREATGLFVNRQPEK